MAAKNLIDMAAQFREWAETLQKDAEHCFVRLADCDLTTAAATLRRALGEAYFSISLEVDCHSGRPAAVAWRVYDSTHKNAYQAKTLTEAVNQALAAAAPAPAEPVEGANRVLNPLPF